MYTFNTELNGWIEIVAILDLWETWNEELIQILFLRSFIPGISDSVANVINFACWTFSVFVTTKLVFFQTNFKNHCGSVDCKTHSYQILNVVSEISTTSSTFISSSQEDPLKICGHKLSFVQSNSYNHSTKFQEFNINKWKYLHKSFSKWPPCGPRWLVAH